MNNSIYLWGDKSSKDQEYASFISFTIDEMMLNVCFDDFSKYLSIRNHRLLYQELLATDDAFSLIIDILHSFQRDSERTFFTADVSSRTYIKLMTFFESMIFKNASFPKDKRLEVLDMVYDSLDKSVLDNALDYNSPAFQIICDKTIEVINNVAIDYEEEIRKSISVIDRTRETSGIMSSDLFFEMTNLMAWIVNHVKHIRKVNSYRIVMCSDIEVAMRALIDSLNRNKTFDFGGDVLLEKTSDSSISNGVTTFFRLISDLLQSVLNRDEVKQEEKNSQLIVKENFLLGEVWKTFQKEGSMWMTSSKTNRKLMEYINN